MKKVFFLIITFIILLTRTLVSYAEPSKVMSLNFDDNSSVVFISMQTAETSQDTLKFVHLENPNRIYFDINNAVLIGEKQQLVFEKIPMKEIRISQFSTNPDVVRTVITFEEDFDTSKIKLIQAGGNIIVKISPPALTNDYFNIIYDESPQNTPYSSVTVNSVAVKKTEIPKPAVYNGATGLTTNQTTLNASNAIMADIQKAFSNSTLPNSDGKTYDTPVSVDLSSTLKLRTKYYISGCCFKNGGLLVSGIGQLSASKMFLLDSPKRAVIDLPNCYVDTKIRNKEFMLCPDGSCKDTAKIGQFEYNKARIVVTSENAEKYIPVFSDDAQSLMFINSDKLNHTILSSYSSDLNKVFVKKINSKTNEFIASFTEPVVYSIVRKDDKLTFYIFNVKSYNEPDVIKTLNNTYYKPLTFSLLPQTGIKAGMNICKDDIVKIEQSLDGKAIRLTIVQANPNANSDNAKAGFIKRGTIKGKVVLDAGHGGTDYGAIRSGINEKDITLDMTQRTSALLKSKGYKVALTRTDDSFVSLEDRVAFAEKEEPEIFVSIHVNSAVAIEPNGIETHYYHDYSKKLAEIIHKHLMKEIDAKDRGLFKSKFYVINHTTMPAVLVETGFISNEEERAQLITEQRKQKTAKAIADGIIEYLKNAK